MTKKKPAIIRSADRLARHPGLYRAQLSCKIGRDAIEGKITPPDGVTKMEWAMFNMLHAIEEIATEMMPNATGERTLPAGEKL